MYERNVCINDNVMSIMTNEIKNCLTNRRVYLHPTYTKL